ncbi:MULTISPECIES: hypothetical protein [unclassified Microcoleus]|uniref:hypothetical protein n=1 Tax=unclassified Microcoleus TaxID=2642155 RepID=UPI002FCE93CD
MNLKKRLPHSPLAIAGYCLIIAIGIMFWGGPISVAGSVAELRIGEGSSSELALREGHRITIVSGHSFSCDWKDASNNINRCRTNLKGRSLEIEFKEGWMEVVPECNIRYSGQSFQCGAFYDMRHKSNQADLWIENSLGLTDFDRIWLFLTNPLANLFGNITEMDWNNITPILSWVVAILIAAALGLHFMQTPRVGSRFAGFILIVPISILIRPIVGWFTLLVLILTRHVD